MELINVQFSNISSFTKRLDSYEPLPKFDQENFDSYGYDLTPIEQQFAIVNGFGISTNYTFHPAIKKQWFYDNSISGAHINHAMILERKGFENKAYEQVNGWAIKCPLYFKLLKIKPKWGIDISIDYCDNDGNVLDIIHLEWDSYNLSEAQQLKQKVEKLIQKCNWNQIANSMLEKKHEWINLDDVEQTKWKCDFIGIERERFKIGIWG